MYAPFWGSVNYFMIVIFPRFHRMIAILPEGLVFVANKTQCIKPSDKSRLKIEEGDGGQETFSGLKIVNFPETMDNISNR